MPRPEALPATSLEAHCEKTLAAGSKSFSFAAGFFSRELREAASFVYAWCRYCDDQIDECPSRELGLKRLAELREKTRSAFLGTPPEEPVFQAFSRVVRKYRIPQIHALELLDGMEMDLKLQTYESLTELRLYCYRVAGTVGLMMAYVMGVSDRRALLNAAELGIAMQLTNISRDVLDDAELGRVYLPLSWLREAGISEPTPSQVAAARNRAIVAGVTRRLLKAAEASYQEGNEGIRFLPWRASLAIAAASYIYRAIGWKVALRGPRAWNTRTVVSKPAKVFLSLFGMIKATFERGIRRTA
jgi:phytoene synthase